MIETVFLGVLILALVIGNLLLFIVPKKQLPQRAQQASTANNSMQPAESTGFEVSPAVKALVLEERLGILNKRLERLEGIISHEGGNVQEKSSIVIAKRLVELEEAKRRMHIEIEALKQRLSRVREELRLPDDAKKKIELGISEEKLHELAFNTAK
ncbi:MAG TPA: hypothetical protein VI977_06030 [archaeon]|nr:hypothetical protein [archaeon]